MKSTLNSSKNIFRFTKFFVRKELLLVLLVVVILGLVTKGDSSRSYLSAQRAAEVGERFESSNSRARYVLTEAIAEQKSFILNLEQARFAAPDVVNKDDRFFSIFTPGISFVAVPFYIIGQHFGIPYITAFFSTAIFAILNVLLISTLTYKITDSKYASWLSGLLFLLGTNALAYALSLTQHHGSTTIILLSLLIAFSQPTWWKNILFGILCGIGFLFDFPNLFFLFPVGIYILTQHIEIKETVESWQIKMNILFIAIALGMAPMLGVFAWYNLQTTGSPTSFAQFYPQSDYFDTAEKQAERRAARANIDPYGDKVPFSTRSQLRSFYILLISPERSWFFYSPLLAIGVLAFVKNKKLIEDPRIILLISIIDSNAPESPECHIKSFQTVGIIKA